MLKTLPRGRTVWPWPLAIVFALLAVLIGGFALFVGWHKATAPIGLLREVTAWTIHLPMLAGRLVGVFEMLAASALLLSLPAPRFALAGAWGAAGIAVLNTAGAAIHYVHAETGTYAQSAVMVPLCLTLVALAFARARRTQAAAATR